jgi:predicted DCC family thiol-disulfide oxidoreductase YuxK
MPRQFKSCEESMNPDLIVAFTLPCMFGWFAWLIFTTFRRYKIAKLQADVQSRLLEKIGSSQDLMAYAQTDAGRQLLESLQVERVTSQAPYGKIIGALQAGIVLFFFGSALLWLRSHVSVSSEGVDGFTIFGALSIAVGLGFGFSAAASYYLSRSFGLLTGRHS